jgi:hypothetical protein
LELFLFQLKSIWSSTKELLVREGKRAGVEVETVAVSTSSEVSDAALALVSRDIDAVCRLVGI